MRDLRRAAASPRSNAPARHNAQRLRPTLNTCLPAASLPSPRYLGQCFDRADWETISNGTGQVDKQTFVTTIDLRVPNYTTPPHVC